MGYGREIRTKKILEMLDESEFVSVGELISVLDVWLVVAA